MATWDRAITIVADARAEKQRWEDIMESIRHKLFLSIPALAIVSPLSRSKRVSPSDFPPLHLPRLASVAEDGLFLTGHRAEYSLET
jgi:hypothetical protein